MTSVSTSPRQLEAMEDHWWRRPLRAIHTVLREPDAQDYDLPGVLDWLRRWQANVYAVNGGGLCAFYQTEVPLHRKNRFLNGRDLFPEIVQACHAAGIKVVARMDFRGGHPETFEAHPDWFSRDAGGAPRMTGPLHAACPNSPYRNEGYAFRLVDEVLGRCGADGIWENAAAFGGRCYCPTCTRRFRDETGHAIPLKEDWQDPVWRRYVRWRYDCVREHTAHLRDVVKAHGADKSYCGEFFTFLEGHARENAEDVDEIAALWDYQMACIFPLARGSHRSPLLPVPVWRAEEQMKYLRATGGGNGGVRRPHQGSPHQGSPHQGSPHQGSPHPNPLPEGEGTRARPEGEGTRALPEGEGIKPLPLGEAARSAGEGSLPTPQTPVMLYGHFDNQSRYTTPAREEMRLWLAGMAAQGGAPWDCSFVGVPPARWWDRRHQDVQESFYGFMAAHEADFAALRSVAEVGVVHSQRTQDRFASADPARDGYITHFRGWELALLEAHVQWDIVTPSRLQADELRRYRALVLPNVACLSDEEAAAIRDFVRGGGALLATYETGCYQADGSRRDAGVLDDLFGVQGLGLTTRGPLPYAYTRLRLREALTAGWDDTDVLTTEGSVRPVTAAEEAQVHATLVPEIVPQPPDLSYPTLWDNDAPLVVTRQVGKGRVVYLAGQPDRLNVTSGHPDHQRLLMNALSWALEGEAPLVTVEAQQEDDAAEVHATLLRQTATGNVYLHLVNYSGARGRPVRTPHPLGPLTVRLHVAGATPTRADLLVSGASVEVSQNGERSTLTIPRLELYEVVRVVPNVSS